MIDKTKDKILGKKILFIYSSLLLLGFMFSFNFAYAATGNTSINFNTGGVYCYKTATNSSWMNASSNSILIADSSLNCMAYAVLGYILPCCPTGMSCNASASTCFDASAITKCDNYDNELSCNTDDRHVGTDSVGSGVRCGTSDTFNRGSEVCINITSCGCKWNSGNRRCEALANLTTNCNNTGSSTNGYCIWSVSALENNCNNSLANIIIRSKARWANGTSAPDPAFFAACRDETRNYPCPNTAKLPFASDLSYVLAILILVIIYLILNRYITRRRNDLLVKYNKKNSSRKVSSKKKL